MINLIPPEAEKVVKREYVFRVGGTLALLLGGVFLVLTVALIPTYVLVGAQIHASLGETNGNDSDAEAFERADAEVKTTKDLLRQLQKTSPTISISDAVEEVRNLAPVSVVFKTIVVDNASGEVDKIQVQGVAPTRDAIARFKTSLESSSIFTKAEVPIADLARDVDVPFTVTITVAEDL